MQAHVAHAVVAGLLLRCRRLGQVVVRTGGGLMRGGIECGERRCRFRCCRRNAGCHFRIGIPDLCIGNRVLCIIFPRNRISFPVLRCFVQHRRCVRALHGRHGGVTMGLLDARQAEDFGRTRPVQYVAVGRLQAHAGGNGRVHRRGIGRRRPRFGYRGRRRLFAFGHYVHQFIRRAWQGRRRLLEFLPFFIGQVGMGVAGLAQRGAEGSLFLLRRNSQVVEYVQAQRSAVLFRPRQVAPLHAAVYRCQRFAQARACFRFVLFD